MDEATGDPSRLAGELPNLWHAVRTMAVLATLGGIVIASFVPRAHGALDRIVSGLIIVSVATLAQLQAAWRLRSALSAFARAFPSEGQVASVNWLGEQVIAWPHLDLSVRGYVSRFVIRRVTVQDGGDFFEIKPRRAREVGEEVALRIFTTRRRR